VRCPADDIVNPLNVFRIIANSELRKASEYYEAVQVKPQHVSLKLRISEFFSAPRRAFSPTWHFGNWQNSWGRSIVEPKNGM
jgi:hypothetical protein